MSSNCGHPNSESLQRGLKFLYHRIIADDEYMELNYLQRKDIPVVNFDSIKEKIGEMRYKNTEEFLADITLMQHNSLSTDSSGRIKRIASALVEYAKNEVSLIDACVSCYALACVKSKWFSSVCEKFHPLVWAKVIGYPYEAAKLLKIEKQIATVHFFGDHKIARVHLKHCFVFSEKSPNQNYTSKTFITQELQEYIKNMGSRFSYAEFGTRVTTNVPVAPVALVVCESPTTSTPTCTPSIRNTLMDLLDKNEQEFMALKTSFIREETEYKKQIECLQDKLLTQKRRHDSELRQVKNQKWCDCCQEATESQVKIFCSNTCGVKWYQAAGKSDPTPHVSPGAGADIVTTS